MLTRKEELIKRMVNIGFSEDKAEETYARYIQENRADDLIWYISICEFQAPTIGMQHSER